MIRNSEMVKFLEENNIDLWSFDEVNIRDKEGISFYSRSDYPTVWDVADRYYKKDCISTTQQLVGCKNKTTGFSLYFEIDFKFMFYHLKPRRGEWLCFRWRFEKNKFPEPVTVIYDHQTKAVMQDFKQFYKK